MEVAEALVHELQHSKLNALFDLADLFSPGDQPWMYAPWLDEPRPLSGLLHGIYAFMSVVEFWDVQRACAPPAEQRRVQFAYGYRARQLERVIGSVRVRPELTEMGREFVDGVAGRLAACTPVDAPDDIVAVVDLLTADHHAIWRMRHLRPDPALIERLCAAWTAGDPAIVDTSEGQVVVSATSPSRRAVLLKARATEPQEIERWSTATPDFALVQGDRDVAATGYLEQIRVDATDTQAWAGLGLARNSPSLTRIPEVVKAVYHGLTPLDSQPDPLALAAWFDRTG
jgi:hypothetical protein